MIDLFSPLWILFYVIALFVLSGLKIVKQYERGVKFTLGKYTGIMEPGLRIVIPIIESWERVDLRIKTLDVPSQEAVSKDNVSLKVNAVIYYKVQEAKKAILEVESFNYAVAQLAQTTMRNIVGEFELDEILAKREQISKKISDIVDKDTDPWGIKVDKIELKDIELPETMKRAMARQAESERDRRSRIILATGEKQASQLLADAAKTIATEPIALHLRLFQTMSDIAAEKNSTIIVPVPTELLDFLAQSGSGKKK
ncbi:TPA: slipin family protein [Candidatus Woesearchaeota archaeon]|nr:slipin family protein [Candidatus Woesearchaeota archaeon]HII68447.1 slipin family protein [Candidatus Woesearchaeota archaeon]